MSPASLARILRTVRHLRREQVVGQIRLRLLGGRRPRSVSPPARLAVGAPFAPFLDAPPHAHGDGWRRFGLLGREVVFAGGPDWDFAGEGPLFAYHLHQFDWARRRSLRASVRRAAILDWIARHREGVGWDGGPLSLRAATWIKLLLTAGALELDAEQAGRLRASLAEQLGALSGNLETHLLANHYLSNLLTLVLAGVAFEGGDADGWRSFAAALRGELAEQVLADGAHYERSPMYHALLLESVLDVLNVCRAAPSRAPAALVPALEDVAARMLGALAIWTHPDGEIALVGDAGLGIAHPLAVLEPYARALGVAPRGPRTPGVLCAAGFARLDDGGFSLLVSAAGPMPAYQPGHAHCDALAFELCAFGERVVTDTGVYEYVPGRLRDRARATASHATIEVDGAEQAEWWAAHRVGGRPRVALVAAEPRARVEATCAGWSTPDVVHRRIFRLGGGALEITDTLEGRPAAARLVLPLAPGLAPRLERTGGATRARVRLRSGAWLRIDLPDGAEWRAETAPYFPSFGRAEERSVLVGRAPGFARGRTVVTLARRAGEPPRPR